MDSSPMPFKGMQPCLAHQFIPVKPILDFLPPELVLFGKILNCIYLSLEHTVLRYVYTHISQSLAIHPLAGT
jgi:hypothetical protein